LIAEYAYLAPRLTQRTHLPGLIESNDRISASLKAMPGNQAYAHHRCEIERTGPDFYRFAGNLHQAS